MALDLTTIRRAHVDTCRIHGVPMQFMSPSVMDPSGEGFIFCPVCRANEKAEFDPTKTRFPEGAEL